MHIITISIRSVSYELTPKILLVLCIVPREPHKLIPHTEFFFLFFLTQKNNSNLAIHTN